MAALRKYLTAFLTCWIVLILPLVVSYHHHSVASFAPGAESVAIPSDAHPSNPDYPSCDICLRLVVQAEPASVTGSVPLSINREIQLPGNDLPHPLQLISSIGERAPPVTIG